ncbi:MAG: transglycosylase SLT domain-containing protein [Bacteroides sp.]|nr:transglycosylase SLT domain-containing protein [Bacteroides sp.]
MKKLILAAAAALLFACTRPAPVATAAADPAPDSMPDTLRVGTLYSPTSFFIYRGDSLGIDYDLARQLADSLRLPMTLRVARSLPQLLAMLDSGVINLVAYPVPITAEYSAEALPCGFVSTDCQVLVQQTPMGSEPEITDAAQLPGREVYVLAGSSYDHRLQNLDSELGGGIEIRRLDPDSVAPEDLIDMVADGRISRAALSADLARLHGSYHTNVNTSVALSLDQRLAWAVAPGNTVLANAVDSWAAEAQPTEARADLLKRYYQLDKLDGRLTYGKIDFSDGTMSPAYDPIFRRWAKTINWDWRLLAAQAYTESRFNPRARSFAGARGLMQIMPRTGRSYGLRNANNPEQSVKAAVSYLDDLNRMFASKVPDPEERKKFILASYNAGQGHIFDAMRLAEKYGLDPTKWDDNVEKTVLMLANPRHYNDNVVKYGYLRGRETFDYVDRIMTLYNLGKTAIPA